MNFFLKIKESIYSPKFYAGIPKQSFGSAIGYFFLLILIITILHVIIMFINMGGIFAPQRAIEKVVSSFVDYYPDNLVVTIKDGLASTNVDEPYYLQLPQHEQSNVANFLVIDTETPFSTTQFHQYDTFFWLTKDSLIGSDDDQIRVIDLSQVEDITVNKQLITTIESKVNPWLKVVTPIIVVVLILGLYIFYIFKLVYLLLLALLIMLIASVLKRSLSYGNAYKTGLYAMTLGFFVELLPLQQIPFLFTIVTLLVVFLNLRVKVNTKK